ncbi:hypothetical protein UPYG_G00148920 [Umbra pygmaea]|uniref:Neural chondroitin sulphate proteoglycan cytoplasmic domain-containing protein n=1 Tax=Umbra pygmaea TaxID=75934 RepID=A0ABD0XHA0_UMBPY
MDGKEARFCTGCRRLLMLSSIIVLQLMPVFVHGKNFGSNFTELGTATNVTSLPSDVEKAVKMNDVHVDVTEVRGSASPVLPVTQRAGRMPRAGEEQGSGMLEDTVVPTKEEVVTVLPPTISPDSAETELLLPSNPRGTEEEEDDKEEEEPTDPSLLITGDGHSDPTFPEGVVNLATTTAPPPAAANPSHPDDLTVNFFDASSRGQGLDLAPPSPTSLAHELQGGEATSWSLPESYDYLMPDEDGASPTPDEYSYSTTTDVEDDMRLTPAPPSRSRPRVPPGSNSFTPDERLRSGGAAVAPEGAAAAPPALPVDGSDGAGGCRQGFVNQNGTCRSPCDSVPSYCFNGGQCYLLEGMGVFCRCNVQDYIWHKGARCESVVTEFQVLCLAIGASALMVLLLFMIIVCFAKKLHVLKTENSKLRKRSKYRPPSEQHNDNFSLSTIAEGSHPNKTMSRYTWECKTKEEPGCEDDPNAQNKLEDPVKAPVHKEDETLNIHNSLTPKHENHKVLGEENSSEVNSLQNNMM